MVCYGGGDDDDDGRVMEWESGLPGDDELTPLSQSLVPPGLAAAFRIPPEPGRTLLDVHRASAATASRLRRAPSSSSGSKGSGSSFAPFHPQVGAAGHARGDERADSSVAIDRATTNNANSSKRPRLVWTPQLHKRFVDMVAHLGIKNVVPKTCGGGAQAVCRRDGTAETCGGRWRRSASSHRRDDGRRRHSASSVLASSRRRIDRATHERTGNRARCLETWGGAPGKTRGSGCPPPLRRLPNSAVIWPVASFRAGFSPRENAGIPEGFLAAKVGLKGLACQDSQFHDLGLPWTFYII
ncbi:uncharacterized protein [Miscanthus floridulus]|uniref:uncharacterized protein n=1 Tax=Miscanthus floridulus TaxID=154761 RepID=UPI00345AA38E